MRPSVLQRQRACLLQNLLDWHAHLCRETSKEKAAYCRQRHHERESVARLVRFKAHKAHKLRGVGLPRHSQVPGIQQPRRAEEKLVAWVPAHIIPPSVCPTAATPTSRATVARAM